MDDTNTVQDTDLQDTIPDESLEQTIDIDGLCDDGVTPNAGDGKQENIATDAEKITAQNSVSEKEEKQEPFISVQYNHKNRDFTKEEAVNFIQKGMHTENLRNKLEYAATLSGVDINALVDEIVYAPANNHRRYLENMYGKGSEEVEIGMKIYREKQSEEYKKIIKERESNIEEKNRETEIKSVNSRLADEYMMLKNQMPDAPEYSKLPDSVIIEAAGGKRDLYSAYLCYLHKEKIKTDAEIKRQKTAKDASAGTMKSDVGDNISSSERGFLSGLWGK